MAIAGAVLPAKFGLRQNNRFIGAQLGSRESIGVVRRKGDMRRPSVSSLDQTNRSQPKGGVPACVVHFGDLRTKRHAAAVRPSPVSILSCHCAAAPHPDAPFSARAVQFFRIDRRVRLAGSWDGLILRCCSWIGNVIECLLRDSSSIATAFGARAYSAGPLGSSAFRPSAAYDRSSALRCRCESKKPARIPDIPLGICCNGLESAWRVQRLCPALLQHCGASFGCLRQE